MQLELTIDKRLPGFTLRADCACEAGIIVLFGPSGSGKSLTLQCLAGIIEPDQGRIVVDGRVLYESVSGTFVPPRNRQIGYVPQSYALFPHMSVEDNIAFGLRQQDRAAARQNVADLIDLLGLSGLEQRRPRELSGGQQQRVALARALAIKPRLLLLDEPFSALDAAIRDVLRGDLLRVHRELGISIVLVTHGVVDTYALADMVAIYQAGQVLQVGTPVEVFRHPISAEVARLTGARNLLAGHIAEVGSRGCWVDVGEIRLRTPAVTGAIGTPVLITIRPEDARLIASEDNVEDDEEVIAGTINSVAPQGHLYGVDIGLGPAGQPAIHVLVPVWWWHRHSPNVGDPCRLAVAHTAINVLGAGLTADREGRTVSRSEVLV